MKKLEELIRAWPGSAWTWDSRFGAVSSTFQAAQEQKALAAIALALPGPFTTETLGDAPQALREICTGSRGLRSGQLAFGDTDLWALWWPWGGGQTITLRIGAVGADTAALKATFSVG